MSDFYNDPEDSTARKPGKCYWCGEGIAPGDKQTTQSGSFDGRMFRSRYHPECWSALGKGNKDLQLDLEDGFGFAEFCRGCCCERGNCQCKPERKYPLSVYPDNLNDMV